MQLIYDIYKITKAQTISIVWAIVVVINGCRSSWLMLCVCCVDMCCCCW
jgi:hypothetical protein